MLRGAAPSLRRHAFVVPGRGIDRKVGIREAGVIPRLWTSAARPRTLSSDAMPEETNMASANKAVIVTGAASGIGLAMTMGLITAGHDVTAVDRNAAGLMELGKQAAR